MMQFENFRAPVIDQAVPIIVPTRNRSLTWPAIAAICFLGLVLFLIAATIVLALIPVYTSRHGATPTRQSLSSTFYLPLNGNTILYSSAFNANQLAILQAAFQQRLNTYPGAKGSTVTVNSASAISNGKRRKRQSPVLATAISGLLTISYPSTLKTSVFNNANTFTVSNDLLTQLENARTK